LKPPARRASSGTAAAAVCLCLCLVFNGTVARAAAVLQGRVLDESTLTPLFSANVRIEPALQGSQPLRLITDAQGRFRNSDLPPGICRVTVSFIGYTTLVRDSVVLIEGGTETLEVQMVPSAIDMEAIIVSASRRPQKYEDAPASAVIVDASTLQSTLAISHTDQLERLPAVDASSTGINSSNVVVRGFNNVLSTTLLSMVDNRLIQIPSLRVNAYQFSTTLDEDIERLELTLGPGSALYGPNAACGVMHIITRSPFSSEGGILSVTGGERDLARADLRWADSDHRRFGCSISGQYYHAFDWKYDDPEEPESLVLFRQGPDGNQYDSAPIDNSRDFEVEKYSGNVRGDLLLGDNGVLTLDAGMSQASNIELTDLGAAQIRDWSVGHVQLRTNYNNLFVQGYVNFSDAGDSYLRRSGARLIDHSKLYVAQIQHGGQPWSFLRLTYGLDAQLTRPETEGTVHGRNENRDNIDAFGGYLQGDLRISSRIQAVAAGRLDFDNVMEDPVTSPRLAVTYRAAQDQTLLLSYNRAFGTPSTTDFFMDILSETVAMDEVDTRLEPYFGSTFMDVRGEGSVDGFHFRRGSDTRPEMVSLYGDLLVADGAQSQANAYLAPDVNSVWPGMRLLLVSQDTTLQLVLPDSLSVRVPGIYADLVSSELVAESAIQDVTPLRETGTSTLEAGYKGRLGKRIAASASVYYTQKEDFVGPLQVVTPHVMIDSASFVKALRDDIFSRTGDSALSQSVAETVYESLGPIPIGLVSPVEYQTATDVLLTRRNFGKVDLVGLDLAATWHIGPSWNVSGTYSFLSQDLFRNVDGVSDVAVNAPRHKFGGALQYQTPGRALDSRIQARWVDGFPVQSGVYVGNVERYLVVNFDLSYRFLKNTSVSVTVQNILDNRHAEFVGSPELGRLAMVRLLQHW
jgi:outer membrane receptor for ferrienterochelin and colicins